MEGGGRRSFRRAILLNGTHDFSEKIGLKRLGLGILGRFRSGLDPVGN